MKHTAYDEVICYVENTHDAMVGARITGRRALAAALADAKRRNDEGEEGAPFCAVRETRHFEYFEPGL